MTKIFIHKVHFLQFRAENRVIFPIKYIFYQIKAPSKKTYNILNNNFKLYRPFNRYKINLWTIFTLLKNNSKLKFFVSF